MSDTIEQDALVEKLTAVAAVTGCSEQDWLADADEALGWFRSIDGRAVLNRAAGVPALADKCNAWLAAGDRTPQDRGRLRAALLSVSGADISGASAPTLARLVAELGRKKKAPLLIERWTEVLRRVHR